MDQRLALLEEGYKRAVADALPALQASGIAIPASDQEWALRQMAGTGVLVNGATYRKHGYGCSVRVGDLLRRQQSGGRRRWGPGLAASDACPMAPCATALVVDRQPPVSSVLG